MRDFLDRRSKPDEQARENSRAFHSLCVMADGRGRGSLYAQSDREMRGSMMSDVRVPRTSRSGRAPSTWATGWTYFASTMMLLIGIFQAIAGLIAILDDEFYVTTRKYVLRFDTTQWGWIHLIVGILIAVAGGYLLTGSVLARTVGVLMAIVSAVAGFAWLPYYPVWGVIIVAIAVSIIWALTAHGRNVANDGY